jgi:ion channel-forming bestrophin family protein
VRIGWQRKAIVDDAVEFWTESTSLTGSATPYVVSRVLVFGAFATLVTAIDRNIYLPDLRIDITPYEVAGAALAVLVGIRTNAGLERWWEARKLWGSIVNESRNLVIVGLANGPPDAQWRDRFVRWAACFSHVCRRSLRDERILPEIARLLGPEDAELVANSEHMPSFVSGVVAKLLHDGLRHGMDPLAFNQAENHRAGLIDSLGGCERILKTPLPLAYAIQIRRFMVLFLVALPFGIVQKIEWITPLATMFAAYPLLSLDKIGTELQNPFSTARLNHLPLDDITATIESNLLAMLVSNEQGP